MDKDKSKDNTDGKHASSKPVIVTHHGKKTDKVGASAAQDTASILPKDAGEVVGNPIDPGINPAKFIKNASSTESVRTAQVTKAVHEAPPSKAEALVQSPPKDQTDFWADNTITGDSIDDSFANASDEKADENTGKKNAPKMPPPVAPTVQKSWVTQALFGFSILSCVAVGAVSYIVYQLHSQIHQLNVSLAADQQSVKSLAARAESSLQSVTAVRAENELSQAQLKTLKSEIEAAQDQLIMQSGKSEWVLNEAYYLIQNADIQLQLNQDSHTAKAQLQIADRKIKALGYPQLAWVREALAKDIAALESTPVVDKHDIWTQLNVLESTLYTLRFKALVDENKEGSWVKAEDMAEEKATWQRVLMQTWNEFKSLIRVSRYDQDVMQPVLTKLEQKQLVKTLGLTLEQAKWALLKSDTIVYHESLNHLNLSIEQYFDATPSRETALKALEKLNGVVLTTKMPDVSQSLSALKKALETSKAPGVVQEQETNS
ncbi:uroporphyrinogen-III C-methyltransferase [Candidatus Berkiella cookevillensis]|uniref:Uroporphyrinogen-III C-methyltransferase n=1 Tax=Candidatus Berkiella cookevillensis TaxID=437022 RepID=A0A0Q9YE64_9GAMM|nr:uroporphyrinogen-III C-methyltransferase [Candidatus Berkiella cookevillensis]MCS5709680.1 uroporphyrinogen-III C-methyltransferase [Candidatus Berkiella cookevillensis]